MTTSQADTISTIQASSKQTRFFIAEDNVSKEVDLQGVTISIVTKPNATETSGKSRVKEKNDTVEILNDAHLRLKTGVHYALVGRNGTGKSTLLRAIADKLIPGLPLHLRIAILQQTSDEAVAASNSKNRNVLETVIEGDPYRNRLLDEAKALSQGTESKDSMAPVHAYRQIKHQALLREFDEVEKMARLRSGARGFDARKVLLEYEQKVKDSVTSLESINADLLPSEIEQDTTNAVDMLGQIQAELETMNLEDVSAKARRALLGLGFSKDQFTKSFSSLSGGWKMRCLLAASIVQISDLLVLDEPTNYLDLFGILWLQKYLHDLKESSPNTTVLLVSHDRDFINSSTTETIILRDKVLKYHPGNVASYDKSVHREIIRMTRMKAAQDKQVAHIEKTIANNKKAYKKTGDEAKSRQAKSRQKKLEDRTGIQVSAKGTRFKLNRDMPIYSADGKRAAIEIPKLELEVELKFPSAPELRFPGSLISLEKVDLKYVKAPEPTLKEVDLVIHRGDRIGILGLNGAGKSTLIKVLTDKYKPTRGTVTRHPRLITSYYSQDAMTVLKQLGNANPSWTALSFIYDSDPSHSELGARKLLAGLGLSGRTASDVPLCKLSGGQLVRVELARIFLTNPHLIIFDEPTTHLDLPTVHALMRGLIAFEGAIVLVSHDRALIRCVVEGEPIHQDDNDSDGSDSENSAIDEDIGHEDGGMVGRFVYEIRNGKLSIVDGGVSAWEERIEKKMRKLDEG